MPQLERPAHPHEDSSLSSAEKTSIVKFAVASRLIGLLGERCERYCILTGYEELPRAFGSDIDFMVGPGDFERMPQLIETLCRDTGTSLFQAVQHEVAARAYCVVADHGQSLSFIRPDSCADYRHYGKRWFGSEEMLASRRWHANGFWILGAAYEFAYYLIKRIHKREFTADQCARLSALYAEDSSGCDRLLQRFWSPLSAQAIGRMAAASAWDPLLADVELYRRNFASMRP